MLDAACRGSHDPATGGAHRAAAAAAPSPPCTSGSYVLHKYHEMIFFTCFLSAVAVASSPQRYVFNIRKTWALSELPVRPVGQPHVPTRGVFGFPEEGQTNDQLQSLILIYSSYIFAQEHGGKTKVQNICSAVALKL